MDTPNQSNMHCIIVTGASRGIGYAAVEALLSEKDVCVVAIVRDATKMEKLCQENNGRLKCVEGDVCDQTIASEAVKEAINMCDSIDGLVLNAGTIEPMGYIADLDLGKWRAALDVNVFGALNFVQYAVTSLRASKGRIVFMSSSSSSVRYKSLSAYCASKAALLALSEILAIEEPDITSVSLRPGKVDTDMQTSLRTSENTDSEVQQPFIRDHEAGKLVSVRDSGIAVTKLVLNAKNAWNGRLFNYTDKEVQDLLYKGKVLTLD